MENVIEIREARLEDYEAIAYMNTESLGYEYPVEKTKKNLESLLEKSSQKLIVACVGDKVIGYIHASDYECTYRAAAKNVMAICVNKQYQGLGAGKKLLAAIEAWAKEDDSDIVRLVSSNYRTGAHEFYKRCGYIENKLQKNFSKDV